MFILIMWFLHAMSLLGKDWREVTMRGWTRSAMRRRASGRLMTLMTKLRSRAYAFPWTAAIDVLPTNSTVGHSSMNLSSEWSTNLLTAGVYAIMVGFPNSHLGVEET